SPNAVTDMELIEACFWAKYWKKGREYPIFNINRLFQLTDEGDLYLVNNRPQPAQMVDCLICEGEADCIAAEMCGFPAVAAKARRYITIGDRSLTGNQVN